MSKDYGSWSVIDLKNELRKRNAKATGKKAVLVQRLEDYDKLFGPLVTDPETVYKITVPTPQYFRDITSNTPMPALDIEEMELFCRLTERDDISKSRNMYNEQFLLSCRLAEVDREYFVTGIVASEMRKNIQYNVTLKLKNHLILEAQCECAAGMGPYAQCKHILVICFAIIDMNKNKTIKMKESVTSNLQTFHQPNKRHTGDPVKAEDLTLKFKDEKYKQIMSFDPRPVAELAQEYTKKFKDAVVNFCGQSVEAAAMPMAQLVKPADQEIILKDHDYLAKTGEEKFLQDRKLTDGERLLLELKTRNNKKLWKQERLYRIHSFHFGRICKSTTGQKKIAESLVKKSDILTPAIKHGLKYEDEAVRHFELKMGMTTEKCGIIVHSEHQFLASTPDRLVGENCVLEIKCPYSARQQKISPENVPYLYLCEETGLLKLSEEHNYYYQVQGQMMCSERQMAYFCVYTITDFKIILIERNDSFIETMFKKLKKFYHEYFENVMLRRFLYNKK